jgi:hypothetical protein
VAVDLARVAAVIDRIAADIDEPARARRVQDLTPAAGAVRPAGDRCMTMVSLAHGFHNEATRRIAVSPS